MEDQEFQQRADEALASLYRKLADATDDFEFDVDFNAGALAVEFEEPHEKFVVSPNSPVRQVWISALVKSFKLDWSVPREAFVLAGTGQSLEELMVWLVQQRLGAEFSL